MQNFLQINKFFVSVVTLFDIFYSRFKRFFGLNVFYKIDFCLINKRRAFFRCFMYSFISQKHVAYSQEKIWHFSLSTFLKYEKLIF